MATAAEVVRRLREERGLTQAELAQRFKKTGQWVWSVETGRIKLKEPLRAKFAIAFGITLADFDRMWQRTKKPPRVKEDRGIPVINKTPAGEALNYQEYGVGSKHRHTYLSRDEETRSEEFFAVQVVGDSMLPRIREGDYAIMWSIPNNYPNKELEGRVVFVHFPADDTCQIARLYWLEDIDDQLGQRVELRRDNPIHKALQVWFSEIDRLALVVQLRGKP
jgi:transcriptional regulator with XRE-family HTH domain